MNLEQYGVTLTTPHEAPVTVNAESWAGLILGLHLHRSNLVKANEVLRLENSQGTNERLAEVQASLIGMAGGLADTLAELLRVGREQGLRFHAIQDVTRQ